MPDYDFLGGGFSARTHHTRSTLAWQFDATGKLVTAPHNLYRQSGDLTVSPWANSGGSGLGMRLTDVIAPGGVGTFTELTGIGSSVDRRQNVAIIGGQTYTLSIYVKRGNQPIVTVSFHMTGGSTVISTLSYNFDTTAITTTFTNTNGTHVHSAIPIGNGIVRLILTQKDDGDGNNGYCLLHNSTATQVTGATGLYWGAQLELNDTARALQTTTTAAYHGPVFDYDPATLLATGLRAETSRTQSIKNSVAALGVGGVGGGTLPTGYSSFSGSGLSRDLAFGVENGMPYTELRYYGTTTAAISAVVLGFTATGDTAASNGQTWTGSLYVKQTAGTGKTINLTVSERDSGSALLAATGPTFIATGTYVRQIATRTLSNATAAFVSLEVRFNCTLGEVVDATFRFSIPQLELGATASSPMLTSAGVFTRGTDTVTTPTAATLDPTITFTRASNAWGFNALGMFTQYGNNVPVFEYDPVTLVPKGLRVEEARTNLLLQSSSFGTSPWAAGAGGDTTLTTSTVMAPDGAFATLFNDVQSGQITGRSQNITITSGTGSYTASVYLKAGTSSVASLRVFTGGGATPLFAEGVINLITGATQWRSGNTGTTVSSAYCCNGWWRLIVTLTDNATGNTTLGVEIRSAFAQTYTNAMDVAATGTVHAWGAQAEQGTFATSHIPTTAATVARVSDFPLTTDLSSFNTAEGTFVVENIYGATLPNGVFSGALSVDSGTLNNRISMIYNPNNHRGMYVNDTSVAQANNTTATITVGAVARQAFAYKLNDFAFVPDGGTPLTDGGGTVPTGFTRIILGAHSSTPNGIMHLRKVNYYDSRLTNVQMQSLTIAQTPGPLFGELLVAAAANSNLTGLGALISATANSVATATAIATGLGQLLSTVTVIANATPIMLRARGKLLTAVAATATVPATLTGLGKLTSASLAVALLVANLSIQMPTRPGLRMRVTARSAQQFASKAITRQATIVS